MQNSLEYVESYLSMKELRKTKSRISTIESQQNLKKIIEDNDMTSFRGGQRKTSLVNQAKTSLDNGPIKNEIDPFLAEKINELVYKNQDLNEKLSYISKIQRNINKLHKQELKKNKFLIENNKEQIDYNSKNDIQNSESPLQKQLSEELCLLEISSPKEFLKIKVGFNEKVQIQIECLDISLIHANEINMNHIDSLVKILNIKSVNVSEFNLSVERITLTPGKG